MNPTWPDLYLHHFQRHFGKPFDVEVYRQDDASPPLRVATFDQRYRNYRVYASLGLTAYHRAVADLGEVILLADAAWKEVPFLFVNSLFFMVQKRIPLGSRVAIGGIDALNPGFAEAFDKAAIYYTIADGFPPGFERISWRNEIGLVYQGIFISADEQDFLSRKGAQEFEARFKAQDEDLCSLYRPSCV